MRWMNPEPIIQSKVSQKEKDEYRILVHIYPEVTKIEKDTRTTMSIAALFIIVGTWKQPRCPSTDESIKKLWYIYTMEYYSAIKRNAFE